jgi:hypothetical protein
MLVFPHPARESSLLKTRNDGCDLGYKARNLSSNTDISNNSLDLIFLPLAV